MKNDGKIKVDIVLPFEGAEKLAGLWAGEERKIDFRREPERAARCTIAYAAMELKTYLGKTFEKADIRIVSRASGESFAICLEAESYLIEGEEYELTPFENSVLIKGAGRIGVLYGAYEFLKLQGWRWYEPGEQGEVAPKGQNDLVLPKKSIRFETVSKLGRGFEFEGHLKESEDLLLWMARNRLNLGGYRPATAALMGKLGISGKAGGHIFEDMLNPERIMPSGNTLWEEHREWFGTPKDGKKEKRWALQIQFCVTQETLIEFLCEELLSYVMNEWKGADRIDVWGFDTWGSVCNCERCRALGNGTDQALYFLSRVRDFLNRARTEGRLDHDVRLVMAVYEGTSTLLPPENPVPRNLTDAGDYVVFCPIVRCYEHAFSYDECTYNQEYHSAFLGWGDLRESIPMMVLEYWNVSKFEDLPLLFTERLKEDIPYYCANGAGGFTYMHLPMVNWAMRTLTQVLYAELIWNPDVDAGHIIEEYFCNRYGQYSEEMKKVYCLLEEAWRLCTSWRAWKNRSVLSRLQEWDGEVPKRPLAVDDHFETPETFEKLGKDSVDMLSAAMELLDRVMKIAKQNDTGAAQWKAGMPVNPIELYTIQKNQGIVRNLGEDKRLLVYGLDTMCLMYRLGVYYNALYEGDEGRAGQLWQEIELLEEKMESYYMPLTFDSPKVELISKDALSRTQLRDTIRRCRKYRLELPDC